MWTRIFFIWLFSSAVLLADSFESLSAASTPTLHIEAKIGEGEWLTNARAVSPLQKQNVTLRVAGHTGDEIRWYRIRADLSKLYKNANFPWDPDPYQWVGFGEIDYHKEELTEYRNQREISPFPLKDHSDLKTTFDHQDVGTFWFQAETSKDGKRLRSYGMEDSKDQRGLSPKVFRVSVRDGEGYLGYVTSYFNVPGLFGSVTYQSSNYIGVDCADMLVAAYHHWKDSKMERNYNVAMLVDEWKKVARFDLKDGQPSREVRWKDEVRPGDLIAVKYGPGRRYQHIGVLYGDQNGNGVLDKEDLILHAGPCPLQYASLDTRSFQGEIAVLRAP